MVEEIVIRNQKFRGILGCPSIETPWKISVSFKPGSWKTYGKYSLPSEAESAWNELKKRKEYEDAKKTMPLKKPKGNMYPWLSKLTVRKF